MLAQIVAKLGDAIGYPVLILKPRASPVTEIVPHVVKHAMTDDTMTAGAKNTHPQPFANLLGGSY